MAKEKNTGAEAEETAASTLPETDSPEVLQAKLDALSAEVLTLHELADLLKQENASLRAEIADLRKTTNQVANSVSIAPPAPAAPERPAVTINDQRYRFKVGEVRLGREVVSAASIAADENRLYEVFSKYPGLFTKL